MGHGHDRGTASNKGSVLLSFFSVGNANAATILGDPDAIEKAGPVTLTYAQKATAPRQSRRWLQTRRYNMAVAKPSS